MKISSTPPIATKVSSVQPATKNSVAFVLNETDEPISRYGHSNSSNGNKQNILSPISSLTTQLQQYMTSGQPFSSHHYIPTPALTSQPQPQLIPSIQHIHIQQEMARKQKDVVAQMTAQRRQQQTFFPSISNIIMPSTSNQQPQNIFLQPNGICIHCNSDKDNLDKDNGNKNYPLWSCGDHVSKFEEEPRDWSQSGWTFYSSESRCKKKLGTNQCKKCGTQNSVVNLSNWFDLTKVGFFLFERQGINHSIMRKICSTSAPNILPKKLQVGH
ncbi:1464_t:CDS:2 [Entrophospora sp. SA101]|nr:1464_t:CDS:2 [Entrophospora sp. SA101]